MQKQSQDKKEIGAAFWQRMDSLIGTEEPYFWVAKHGITKSTFQSAKARGNRPLTSTLKDWAAKIGCDYDWLKDGVGVAFPGGQSQSQSQEQGQSQSQYQGTEQWTDNPIDLELLEKSIETLETILSETRRSSSPKEKSRLISNIYKMYSSTSQPDQMRNQIIQLIKMLPPN